MKVFAVLCLAAVALAKPQDYSQQYSQEYGHQYSSNPVTTVTERTITVKGDAADASYQGGYSGYSGSYGYAGNQAYSAPASYSYESATAAPAVQHTATYYHQQHQAPLYQGSYQAVTPVAYHAVPVAYHAVTPVAYQAYQSYSPAYYGSYGANYYQGNQNYQQASYAPSVTYQSESNNYNYQGVNQAAAGETKVYKHVYAFAAPEEPATRARINIQAPVSKKKHYKLVFIKTPSQQTVVDSDITLPAQEEEKTLIYVLSKNQKQAQPEIRIKQQEASKHAKPEVFFLKYNREDEAQAIANGAISGQNADVPANGEIISDGSVSILGKSGAYNTASYNTGVSTGVNNVVYNRVANVAPLATGVSQYSVGTVGIIPAAQVSTVTAAPITYTAAPVAYNAAPVSYTKTVSVKTAPVSTGFSTTKTVVSGGFPTAPVTGTSGSLGYRNPLGGHFASSTYTSGGSGSYSSGTYSSGAALAREEPAYETSTSTVDA